MLHPNCSFPSHSLLQSLPHSFLPLPHTLQSSVSVQKGEASHGYQQNMTLQVAIRLSFSPYIKARQSSARNKFPRALETAPVPIVRSPTSRTSYKLSHICGGLN